MATIVVINHDTSLTLLLETTLRRAGYDVLTARDGNSGLRTVMASQPDIVIVSARLPGLSGQALSQQLRATATTTTIPIIVCSTDHLLSHVPDGVYDAYLRLPARPNEIVNTVKTLLDTAGHT